ncbi:hypothetical protein GN956_G9540 [Arapaima gigas]
MNADRAAACLLFDDEQDVHRIEDAVRAAIAAVLQVFCAVSTARIQECGRKAAEAQRENSRLRLQLETAERELLRLRRLAGPLEAAGAAGGAGDGVDGDPQGGRSLPSSPRPKLRVHLKEPLLVPAWKTDLNGSCEKILVSPPARDDDSHIPEVSFTTVFDQQSYGKKPTSISPFEVPVELERSPRAPANTGNQPHMKEEPPDFETVYVKCEVSKEQVREEQGGPLLRKKEELHISPIPFNTSLPLGDGPQGAASNASVVPSTLASLARNFVISERLSNRERQKRYREKIRADPERQRIYRERDRCRYQKRRKLICELSEQSQKLRRQAWREAARRHRARKKSSIEIAQFPCLENVEPVVHSAGHLES